MLRQLQPITPLSQARPTLGALKISLHNTVERVQWNGLLDAARQYDVNLLGFFGEALHIPDGFSAQANIVYSLINPDRVDGLIVFSEALESYVEHRTMEAFLRRFHPLPVVSVERRFPGIPAILMDNYQAMRAVMRHLIEDHRHRRIAFIRGPIHHFGAQERYRAYADALADYGLPAPPELVTPPVFWVERRAMIAVLVEERGLRPGRDFDALATAWDYQAFRSIEYLNARGVRIPDDVAVTGFDNDEVASAVSPALTTVQPPFYAMAGQAIATLLDVVRQRDVPEQVTLPTTFVIRQSCGCRSQAFARGDIAAILDRADHGLLPELQPDALARALVQTLELPPEKRSWAVTVVQGFWAEWREDQSGRFLEAFEDVLGEAAASGGDVGRWQTAVSLMRQTVLAREGDADRRAGAEALWHQARACIGEIAASAHIARRFREKRQERRLQAFEAALSTTFNVQGVLDAIREGLPRLGVPGCYLIVYDGDSFGGERQPYRFPDPVPEWSRLLLAYDDDGQFPNQADGLRFPTRHLLPEQMLPRHGRVAMVVESLYFREEQIGFALFEVGPDDGTLYEALRLHISNALHGALLFAEVARQTYILDMFMKTIPDRIYFKALDGRITRANRAHASRLGLRDPGEEIGKTDFDFLPHAQAHTKFEQEQHIIRTGQPLIGLEEPDGQGRWVLTTKMPLRDEAGAIIGTFGISRDITHLKQTEQELRQYRENLEGLVEERTTELSRSNALLNEEVLERLRVERALRAGEEQYRMLAEHVKDGIIVLQHDRFVFANAIFASMTGHAADRPGAIDARAPFLAQLLDVARQQPDGSARASQDSARPIELLTGHGRALWVDVEPTAIVWNSQPAVLLTVRDVTDRKQREQRLEQERARLEQENLNLRSSIRERYRFGPLVGKSPAMQRLYELIVSAAASDVNVLISGESGTGKELIARTLHQVSRRKQQAFVAVNCASIPETLFEREFFGHRKGAFTGADRDAPGLFDRAHQGLLFLDEVTELSPGTQAKLLRVLQDGEYTPLGSNMPRQADALIVAATNRDCQDEMAQGRLRQDFFYRLGIIELCVPALRARKEDLPLLIEHLLEAYRQKVLRVRGQVPDDAPTDQSMLPAEFVQALYQYQWPGNIRELQNVLQRYLATRDIAVLPAALPGRRPPLRAPRNPLADLPDQTLPDAVKDFEKALIADALARHHQRIRPAAEALGLPLRTLYHKIKLYGL